MAAKGSSVDCIAAVFAEGSEEEDERSGNEIINTQNIGERRQQVARR
jgi:hypothetical protein